MENYWWSSTFDDLHHGLYFGLLPMAIESSIVSGSLEPVVSETKVATCNSIFTQREFAKNAQCKKPI